MKRMCIITISQSVAETYKSELNAIFENSIEIDIYSAEKTGFSTIGTYDLYLVGVTSSSFFQYVTDRIDNKSLIVTTQLTFSKDSIKTLKSLDNCKALYVNLSENMANESITDLYRIGINNIDFVPYFPNSNNAVLPLAVTSGESRYVPDGVEMVIDLGDRLLSANTVTEIILKLEQKSLLTSENYLKYIEKLIEHDYSINRLSDENINIENKYEVLINQLDIGVISISKDFKIQIMNDFAEKILGMEGRLFYNHDIYDIFPNIERNSLENKLYEDFLIEMNEEKLTAKIVPLKVKDKTSGYYILINKFYEIESRQINLRKQLLKKANSTKYTFKDIITNNEEIQKTKEIAYKMARTDLSILLTGESGTGKELFAHSIHNASSRSDKPFLAINCAALPDNLLESELFGYVSGAFTGALKNGKIGLFEYAHRGSIFLDEIEMMSPYLQAKLLRVLEEKEIMKVGDTKTIDIDVRIIAASNENIYHMVKNNLFRKDLYYRLNTLPIDILPLRKRVDDIPILIEHIKKTIHAEYELSDACMTIFNNYSWDGNVRELKNILEYLKFINKKVINIEDLPPIIKSYNKYSDIEEITNSVNMEYYDEKYIFILKKMLAEENGIGRNRLFQLSKQEGLNYTESEIRNALYKLSSAGYISKSVGRAGSRINKEKINEINLITRKHMNID